MAEYIEREDTINSKPEGRNPEQSGKEEYNKGWNDCRRYFVRIIESQPAADVAPVVHGRWMTWVEQFPGFKPHINDKLGVFCSLCHAHSDCISPYCPNCGAKIDEGKGDFIE